VRVAAATAGRARHVAAATGARATRRSRGALALALFALGLASLGEAARIHAKAWIGQRLIERAWTKRLRGEEAARPWPWADTWPVARIELPAHGVDLVVLAGSSGRTLAWGPGHLAGTAPVGAPGNSVVGGHRDTHFAFLRDVPLGASIRAEDVEGRVRTYRVVERFVTDEHDAAVLAPTSVATLTLVTCWPFDTPVPGGDQRYVVVAEEAGAACNAREWDELRRGDPDRSCVPVRRPGILGPMQNGRRSSASRIREGMSEARASTRGWLRRRSRWVRWGLGVCAVLAVLAATTWFATPWFVRTSLLPRLWAQYGLTVTAERRELSIADGTAAYHGVRVFDGEDEVLTAKRMEVRVSLRGLYAGRTIFERIVVDDPVVRVHLGADGRTNVGRILERGGSQAGPRPATLWEDVVVHGGIVEWDDRPREVSLRILAIEATVLDMQAGSGERLDRFGQITIDADLEQPGREPAPLSIVHWAPSSGGPGSAFVAHAALTGIDLDSFPGLRRPDAASAPRRGPPRPGRLDGRA
jgi:sortase A